MRVGCGRRTGLVVLQGKGGDVMSLVGGESESGVW